MKRSGFSGMKLRIKIMKTFIAWLNEVSLSGMLRGVPQNPKHHPEGDVLRHTTMVRSALDSAIKLLQDQQKDDPQGPFSSLDLQISSDEYNILRIAGWMHDIGKVATTDPDDLTSHGHDQPENFEKDMRNLSPEWQKMYSNASQQDKDDLWYIIRHHMNLSDKEGFRSKSLKRELIDSQGKYKSERKVKLLLILLLMDRLGRGSSPDLTIKQAKEFAKTNLEAGRLGIGGMYKTSELVRKAAEEESSKAKPVYKSPKEFVIGMRQQGKSDEIIKQALIGKFRLSQEDAEEVMFS